MPTPSASTRLMLIALAGVALAACEPQEVTTGADVTLASGGGQVVAHCALGKAEIVSATAADGYTADIIVPGPSSQASVYFIIEGAPDVRAAITCSGGEPQLHDYERERNDYVFP